MLLPESFRTSMKALLADEYDDLIKAYDEMPQTAIRINTCKISAGDFEKIAPFDVEKIPFADNAYYIKDTDAWSKHPYYFAGLYYIQEPSAMLPALTIPLDNDCNVLDLCAAPGGKSTGICTRQFKTLVSNDISFSRTIPLVRNLERFGARSSFVTCEDPAKLSGFFPVYFDRILVDAPCSGEGMFRKDRSLITAYEKKGPKEYCTLQRNILEDAYRMLAPGGYILYSTCTFSDIEDEQVIIDFVGSHDDIKVCEIKKEHGLAGPYKKYSMNDVINGCVHAFWHRFRGEGHFMALIHKGGYRTDRGTETTDSWENALTDAPDEIISFADSCSEDLRQRILSSVFLKSDDGFVYMIPRAMAGMYKKGIRYVRTGTCMGMLNRYGKFTPHTAFAMSIKAQEYRYTLDFTAEDPNVIKYLKGETLITEATDLPVNTHILICVDGHPLGFALYDGNKLKNLYEKGWIYR